MSESLRLRQGMTAAMAGGWSLPPVPKGLHAETAYLKRMLGGGDGGGRPPKDRTRDAVNHFSQYGTLRGLGDARLVCYGSIERFSEECPPLIEHHSAFPRLLEQVESYSLEPRPFRRCYRGLLHCYFTYDPDTPTTPKVGLKNWERLRDFLFERHEAIRLNGYEPPWVHSLAENRQLLGTGPAKPYARAALEGNTDDFARVCQEIEIAETSWLVRQLVLEQVEFAAGQGDAEFKAYVGPLLDVLQSHPVVKHQGLARVVNRYAEAQNREEHPELREAAIAAWGNPLLELNRPKWSSVSDAARRMVAGWTTRILIRQFFEVLAHDRHTDRRRLQFWERYHECMDSVYYALGPTARWSRSPDIRRLRDLMGSNQLGLSQGGGAANNAFIMVMGRYVVVEFGLSGNASFIFHRDSLPFMLNGELAGDSSGLKHPTHVHRLLHVNTSHGSWESEFERVLGQLGIRPGSDSPQRRQPQERSAGGRDQQYGDGPAFSRQALQALALQQGLTIKDMTQVGGRLWVSGAPAQGAVAQRLSRWQFRWASLKGAWYRKGWD